MARRDTAPSSILSSQPKTATLDISPEAERRCLERWDKDVIRAAAARAASTSAGANIRKDLEQEARIGVLLALRRGKGHIEPYVRRTIVNAITKAAHREMRTHIVAQQQSSTVLDSTEDHAASHSGNDLLAKAALADWVDRLPHKLRHVYEHLYVDGCTQRRTADCMGASQPRIAQLHRDLLSRARVDLVHLSA